MSTETITWVPCAQRLPDAELNLLVLDAECGTVLEAFLDGEDADGAPLWRDVTAVPLGCVTHWAEMPSGPNARLSGAGTASA
jgi:hypothetical protein